MPKKKRNQEKKEKKIKGKMTLWLRGGEKERMHGYYVCRRCGAFRCHCGARLRKVVFTQRLSSGSIPSYCTSGSTQPEWEEGGQPNSGPLCTFAEQTNQAFFLEKEGNFSPKEAVGMKEAGSCRDRRTKRTNPLVLIGTIEERKRMVSPFAQGTSSENNVGDRWKIGILFITRLIGSDTRETSTIDRADAEIFFLFEVQEEEEKRNHRPMVLLERTVCDCSYPTPREVLVTAPQVVSEMLLREQRKKRSLLYSRSRNSGTETATLRMIGVLH
ncbi:hypothetical protein E3N88_44461 [Mikania micrantha]|uniref:Uncharacterized protein n=1 Tax=Mikania micrantha TaxID=192012 RepID=A0A5N6LC07_9ASTR|nr:hypothetical protein E3N88_44461 [Mikania micrantha]